MNGNLRVLALKELHQETAPCLIAKILRPTPTSVGSTSFPLYKSITSCAIDKRVSKERLARSFNANLSTINNRINLLHETCSKAKALLQDHQFPPDVTRHLGKMKAARQIEAVENDAARELIARHAPLIQDQFELLLNAASMEEAVERTGRATRLKTLMLGLFPCAESCYPSNTSGMFDSNRTI